MLSLAGYAHVFLHAGIHVDLVGHRRADRAARPQSENDNIAT